MKLVISLEDVKNLYKEEMYNLEEAKAIALRIINTDRFKDKPVWVSDLLELMDQKILTEADVRGIIDKGLED